MLSHKQRVKASHAIRVTTSPIVPGYTKIEGKVLTHMEHLRNAMALVTVPKKGQPGHLEYKRQICDLIADLHFHLSNLE